MDLHVELHQVRPRGNSSAASSGLGRHAALDTTRRGEVWAASRAPFSLVLR